MLVEIYNQAGWLCPLLPVEQKEIIKAMHKLNPVPLGDLSVYIVRDDYIMQLNNKFLYCQGPTNVLSFPAYDFMHDAAQHSSEHIPHTLVISVDTLQRECLLYGQELIDHFLRLLAHGLAHIMGYDHGAEMFNLCAEMEEAGQAVLSRTNMV